MAKADSRPYLSCTPFSVSAFKALAGADNPATEYVGEYLKALGVRSLLIEEPYVDRHFLDEYATYYSRSFRAPVPRCKRIHAFVLADVDLSSLLDRAYESLEGLSDAESKLQEAYRGFIVIRPLRGAELGRTVLTTYAPVERRHYEVVRPYVAHVGGLKLEVHGLAYQQQDGGTSVCASIALWSALQKVAHLAGHRTPTPPEVTRAAHSPFPATHGLDLHQMATAITNLGYAADLLVPGNNRPRFRANLMSALRSHLPVVLCVLDQDEANAHAVTVTGYSDPLVPLDVTIPCAGRRQPDLLPTADASVRVIYVHDDNLGSHVHYELFDSTREHERHDELMLRRASSTEDDADKVLPTDCYVSFALVPKPTNLRMSLETLQLYALEMKPLFEGVFGSDSNFSGVDLVFETRFDRGVDYRRMLIGDSLDRASLQKGIRALALPRFVGVVSARTRSDRRRLCDALIDVSEAACDTSVPRVLAFIAPGVDLFSPAHKRLREFALGYDVDVDCVITGPVDTSP
jgi:hypothetical protein